MLLLVPGPAEKFCCLLWLGPVFAAVLDYRLASHWTNPNLLFTSIGLSRTVPAFAMTNGILTRRDCLQRALPDLQLLFTVLLTSCVAVLLLRSGIEPNPGPTSTSSSQSVDSDVPSSTDSLPVICTANICGLHSKVLQLSADYLLPYKIVACALQETKLPSSCHDPSLQIQDYSLFRKDRTASGGGVAIYVPDSLNPCRFRSHVPPLLELVAVEVYFGKRRLILLSVYLPPRTWTEMEDRLSDLSDWIAALDGDAIRDLVLLGDLNLCPMDVHVPSQRDALTQLTVAFQLHQIVHQPTHGDRLIDHCFISDQSIVSRYGCAATLERKKWGHADGHSVVWIQLQKLRAPKPAPVCIDSWKWADFDLIRALFLLSYKENGDEHNLVAEMWQKDTVDMAAEFLSAEFLCILHLMCPHRVHRFWRYVPWMNHSLASLVRKKKAAWKQLK